MQHASPVLMCQIYVYISFHFTLSVYGVLSCTVNVSFDRPPFSPKYKRSLTIHHAEATMHVWKTAYSQLCMKSICFPLSFNLFLSSSSFSLFAITFLLVFLSYCVFFSVSLSLPLYFPLSLKKRHGSKDSARNKWSEQFPIVAKQQEANATHFLCAHLCLQVQLLLEYDVTHNLKPVVKAIDF